MFFRQSVDGSVSVKVNVKVLIQRTASTQWSMKLNLYKNVFHSKRKMVSTDIV